MPAMLELRIRACHVRGSFECKDNVAAGDLDARADGRRRPAFDYMRLAHPPVDLPPGEAQGARSGCPAARRYIAEHGLNELIAGRARRPRHHRAGRPVQRAARARCSSSGLADAFGASRHPAAGAQRHVSAGARAGRGFCAGKRAVLVVEEGQPEYIEQEIATRCAGATSRRRCTARTCCRRRANTRSRCWPRGLRAVRRSATLPELGARVGAGAGSPAIDARRAAVGDAARRAAAGAPAAASASAARSGRCSRRSSSRSSDVGPVHIAGRHRLPRVRHLRAVLDGPLDPRLRHEPRQPRRRVADDAAAHAVDHGRRRLLAQRPAHRRAVARSSTATTRCC